MEWVLTRGRWPLLVGLALVVLGLGGAAARIGVEHDNASLNARDPVADATDAVLTSTFGSDADLILAVRHPRLLERDGLAFVAALTRDVAALGGVRRVLSPTNATELVAGDLGAEEVPLLPPPYDRPDTPERTRAAFARNPQLTGLLIAADRRTAGLLIEVESAPGADPDPAVLITALRRLMAERRADGVDLYLTGLAVQKHDVSAYIAHDQRLLVPLAVATLTLVLAAFFRRVWAVALALAVTGSTVATTLGLYHLAGLELNAITALLPPVLMVLSLAVSVHLIQGYFDATAADPVARVRAAVRPLLFPCAFSALTTALGFVSLLANAVPAVRAFGAFAAIGVLLSFAIGMTLVPIGLTFVTPPRAAARTRHPALQRVLAWSATTVVARPRTVLTVFAVLTAVAFAGVPLVRNNTDLVRFLKADAPLRRDTMAIDATLTGADALDFIIERRDGAPMTTLDDMHRLASLEAATAKRAETTTVLSVLAVLRQVHRAERGAAEPALPADAEALAAAIDLVTAAAQQPLVRKLVAGDFTRVRLHVRVRAVGTAVAAPLVADIVADARRRLGPAYRVRPTGAYWRMVADSNDLVRAQTRSFGLALVLVFAAIAVLFRSPRLFAVTLVPNLMPVVWTAGVMGACGIDLSTGTAMIASAVIGLVVDDTIHYLTHFFRARTDDARAAVRQTTTGVGAALVLNNLVLVLGFWVGCFGSFKPTIYFSLLAGLAMLGALVCDLLVTPACLLVFGCRPAHGGAARVPRATAASLVVGAVLLGSGVPVATAAAPAHLALLDAGADVDLAATPVPSAVRRVGEVRVIRRGAAAVVQTRLETTILRRAVAEIGVKERASWPTGAPGRADAERYVAALRAAAERLPRPPVAPPADRRQRLLIEFVLDADDALVVIGPFEPAGDGAAPRSAWLGVPTVLELGRAYVRGNMEHIVADAFDPASPAAARLAEILPPLDGVQPDGPLAPARSPTRARGPD
jgi:hypothetical protein